MLEIRVTKTGTAEVGDDTNQIKPRGAGMQSTHIGIGDGCTFDYRMHPVNGPTFDVYDHGGKLLYSVTATPGVYVLEKDTHSAQRD